MLDVLQKNKNFRAQLDHKYRERALSRPPAQRPHLQLTHACIHRQLRSRVQLDRYAPGEVIFDRAIRPTLSTWCGFGFVKVTEDYAGGELVLAYLSKGGYFGEIGLLGGGIRTATCSGARPR